MKRFADEAIDDYVDEWIDALIEADEFSRNLPRFLASIRRTPVAVGEIVTDTHRDRGRGQLVRRWRYHPQRNRLLVSHDHQGRVFGEIYNPNMRNVVPRTLLGNLPQGTASNEANVRNWLNQLLGTRFVHATQRRGNTRRGDRGPDLVPQRFDEFDAAIDDFSWNTPKRWGCKARCAWMYGEGCREGCGLDFSCITECNRRLYECNADCDRSYPS